VEQYEANILIPTSAWDALEELRARTGLSRDRQVRALIERYVDEQAIPAPDDRQTHISTVLWHPAPPVGRRGLPPDTHLLRLRLAAELAAEARRLALKLPGQTVGPGGHHDYRAGSHADAFLTALAGQIDFEDSILRGLPRLITHGCAVGLFRLAAAATASEAERAIFRLADSDLIRVRTQRRGTKPPVADAEVQRAQALAHLLREEEDVAWHGAWRRDAVRHLAGVLLTSDDSGRNQVMLHDKGEDFVLIRTQLERDRHRNSDEVAALTGPGQDWEGRGGTAVWRAERLLAIADLVRWIASHAQDPVDETWFVDPPEWRVAVPNGWVPVVVRGGTVADAKPYSEHANAGRVLGMRSGSRHVFWPYRRNSAGELAPVPGVDAVASAARDLPPARIAETMLVQLDDEVSYLPLGSTIAITAAEARGLGLIDSAENATIEEHTRRTNEQQMQRMIDAADDEERHDLRAVSSDIDLFAMTARKLRVPINRARPSWEWPHEVRSLACEIEAGLPPEQLADTPVAEPLRVAARENARTGVACRCRQVPALGGRRRRADVTLTVAGLSATS
jgi:hypothetical protein